MDWSFEAILPDPIHPRRRIKGVAEIVGKQSGAWQVGNIYLLDCNVRIAGYDERRQIEEGLKSTAGQAIGRAYRRTLEGLHHDND